MPLHTLSIKYDEFNSLKELPEDEQKLILEAQKARRFSYAPYSGFHVGAAIASKDGHIVVGSNQETSNHKSSCAERVALDTASAAGLKDQIAKIAIASQSGDVEPAAPCGQCRQDIKEVEDLAGSPMIILLAGQHKIRRMTGISNLLPFAFGVFDMKKL